MGDGNTNEPFEPTIKPIKTVNDFNTWKILEWVTDASVARVPLATPIPLKQDGPSSMAGFDNGPWQYDPWFTQWSQGGHGQSADGNRTAANVYNFSFWQYLDVCYYFGHDLLTIPPTVWTNAAHKNGVSCLGTLNLDSLVLEHEEKDKDFPVLEFLSNMPDISQELYDIAFYFNFDGYLFNYEYYDSTSENQAQIAAHIRGIMHNLNELVRDKKKLTIVWYDSPISGDGQFQNRLTRSAKDFFVAAQRFQGNYSWGPAFPGTENYPELSGKLAQEWDRPRNDVTMMLDCYKRDWRDTRPYYTDKFFSALQLVVAGERPPFYTGLGCYCPGWIAFDGLKKNTERMRDRDTFHQNDRAFWAGTADFQRDTKKPPFPPDGPPINPWPKQCMAHYVEERSVVTATPFVTTFNTGEGDFYNIEGKKWADTPWNNLSDQSVLPTWQFHRLGSAPTGKAEIDYGDAFTGGSCIRIDGSVSGNQWELLFLLYKTNVLTSTTTQPQTLTLTIKPAATYTSVVCGAVEVDAPFRTAFIPPQGGISMAGSSGISICVGSMVGRLRQSESGSKTTNMRPRTLPSGWDTSPSRTGRTCRRLPKTCPCSPTKLDCSIGSRTINRIPITASGVNGTGTRTSICSGSLTTGCTVHTRPSSTPIAKASLVISFKR